MNSVKRGELSFQVSPGPVFVSRKDPVTIIQKSLREQVYEFLREELSSGKLVPGSAVNLAEISRQLGVSKTPLRDALLQLDTEGFVTISPRRGVFVNKLSLDDIKHSYQIVGALESAVILAVFDRIEAYHLSKMKWLNSSLIALLEREDYESYYLGNIEFHNVFLDLSGNEALRRIILPIKQRLYDFPRRGYIKEWEMNNCREHEQLIQAIESGDRDAAVRVWMEVHWSFPVQKEYIRRFYFPEEAQDSTRS